MKAIAIATRIWLSEAAEAWDRFWFTPARPATLALMRIFAGLMLFYTHFVWGLQLQSFLGPNAWVDNKTALELQRGWYTWSYLWYIESPALLWTVHIAALVVFALLAVGLWTRVVSVLACFITLAYCHRLHGALFGLDQVNAMLAMYLMLAPCGEVFSVDRWLKRRRAGGEWIEPRASVMTNIATRLIQLHMCIIYLFGGISKLRGDMWWDGSAVWFAFANLEYQSLDMTWMARHTWLVALMTHLTIFWETFYCFMVWPKWSRPITLALAVAVHGGIAIALGMPTFGLAMLIGNLAFVSPEFVEKVVGRIFGKEAAEQGRGGEAESEANPIKPSRVGVRKPRSAAKR